MTATYAERVFASPSIDAAIIQAPLVAGLDVSPRPIEKTLDDAFDNTLKQSDRRDRATLDWDKAVKKFSDWLVEHHPAAGHWNQLTRSIVREYFDSWRGKSDNTIRLIMQPLRQTSRFMHEEHGFDDIAAGLGTGTRLAKPTAQVHFEDVLDFLDYLKATRTELEAGAALQSLAGLQLQEFSRLTWSKIDLSRGLIEISGEVKNEYRNRVIPICQRVREAFKRATAAKIQTISGLLMPWEHWSTYSHEIADSIKKFVEGLTVAARKINPKAKTVTLDWAPKDLRNCLPTFAMRRGIHGDIWEQYIGHAPKTVTARHYVPRLASTSRGHDGELDRHMEVFREHVVAVIDLAILEDRARREKEKNRKEA